MIKSNNFMEGVFHKIRRPNPWEAGNYINCYSQGILVHVERLNFNEEGLNKNPSMGRHQDGTITSKEQAQTSPVMS
ncbi:hypothetical protein F8388_009369 [Cannabis sativa]|uniref:Uncharacterized protein n=1 Tax=Cannabis sativa TaxID=3483 RepID=A0A7J6GKK0_CANSA|nr:hypothetical protein F8388_009369 [Cannabis sativa]KAF4393274.1 hypothetical protein G4B88_002008 [Cannabis sativa]